MCAAAAATTAAATAVAAAASAATAAVSAAGDGAALLPTNLANWILRGWINEYLSKSNSSSSCHS